MASFEGRVSFSSLPKLEKGDKSAYQFDDDYSGSVWTEPQDKSIVPFGSKSMKNTYAYQFPAESDDFIDGGYDVGDDVRSSVQNDLYPEVNLKNVLSGLVAIVTGRNKGSSSVSVNQQYQSSNISFLGSGKNGDTYLHSSVYTPSAPPLLESSGIDYSAYKEVLEAEPPEWIPDSATTVCMQCSAPLHLHVADIIAGFVEGFSAEHVLREGVCYLLNLGKEIPRGCVILAMTGLIHCRGFLSIPLAMLCK